jgi:hypothetical protein
MCLLCVLCVVRGFCDKLITRPEESYLMWWVVLCDLENLVNEEALAHWGVVAPQKKIERLTVNCANLGVSVCNSIFR